jgi:hypothetical protein
MQGVWVIPAPKNDNLRRVIFASVTSIHQNAFKKRRRF